MYDKFRVWIEHRHTKRQSRMARKTLPKDDNKMMYGVDFGAAPQATTHPLDCAPAHVEKVRFVQLSPRKRLPWCCQTPGRARKTLGRKDARHEARKPSIPHWTRLGKDRAKESHSDAIIGWALIIRPVSALRPTEPDRASKDHCAKSARAMARLHPCARRRAEEKCRIAIGQGQR